MTLTAFLAYCAIMCLAAAMPGPAMFAVISNGVTRGFAMAFLVGIGIAAADAVLVTMALLGLVALVQAFEWIFLMLKYAGAAYLVYLGIRMIRAKTTSEPGHTRAERARGKALFLGASIGLGNPKAILFHASVMPLLLNLSTLTMVDGLYVIGTVFAANAVIMGGYAGLAGVASRWFKTEKRMRWMNRIAGGAMVGTGALIVSR